MREREIFIGAFEKHGAAERSQYLDAACAGDQEMRERVERLLAEHEKESDFLLDHPPLGLGATVDVPRVLERPGMAVGPYKLLEEIGEGGFGVVYMAEQEEPVRRRVALKVIKPGMDSRDVIARFDAERQALAMMDHPNVARVLDAGATDHGRPYFVMDLIKGISITEYSDEAKLSTRERLELFLEVCQGVQHAHQKGVIHRDLKPSNVLVTLHGSKPVPKVIDFGVAKAIHQRLTEHTLYTRYAQMVGTPLYMSPEQAALSGLDVDTRSDIYSLGVLLYELFTGTTPLARDQVGEASYDEIRRAIRETEPPTPSQRLSTTEFDSLRLIATRRGTEPGKITDVLRGDLDWITMKALEKDRTRRYETVGEFAQDIGRYLSDQPVEARPPSKLYRVQKFVRRNRSGLVIAACVALAIVAVVGSVGWIVGERTARLGEAARLAETALADAEAAVAARDWAGARVAALRAQGLILSRGSDRETEEHVDELLRDLDMVAQLEALRIELAERASHGSGLVDASAPYDDAFANYGLTLETLTVDEAARRIRARSRIIPEITSGLEDWAEHLKNSDADHGERWRRLLAIAQSVDPHPLRNRIRELWAADDEEGIAGLAAAARLEDVSRFSLERLVRALHGTGATESAVAVLERAWELDPGDIWINDQLAHHLHNLERWDDALRFASSAVALRPTGTYTQLHLGIALEGKGRPDEAIAAYERALRFDPTEGSALVAHTRLGNKLFAKGLVEASIAHYRESLRIDPDDAVSQYNIATALGQSGRFDEAIDEFRALLRRFPNNAEYHRSLGDALSGSEQLDRAIAAYREAIRIDPGNLEYHNNLGTTLLHKGRHEEAIAAFREAVRLAPDPNKARRNLAAALWNLGRLEEIVTVFGELFRRRPDDSEALGTLATALKGLGRHLAVARLYRDAFRERPKLAQNPSLVFPAALAATAASAGLGEDADQLDEDTRALLRDEALRWLRRCLELDRKTSCEAWFVTPELTSIREEPELARLPEDEAARFRGFWARVRRREIPIIERRVAWGELPGEPVELREHRRAVLPDLVTFASIDAALEDARAVDLIPAGASWKYLRGRAEPSSGLEWIRPEFDDAGWAEGASGFGYGDGDDETTFPDMQGSFSSIYLRREFEITGLERYEAILLEVLVDDGYVAYLNGEEIGRANAGSVERPSFEAFAPWGTNDPFYGPPIDVTDKVRQGANILAIQGLNSTLTSSDFSLLPVLRGLPKGRVPDAERFAEFRRVVQGSGGERRVAYLDGRLLELRGEYEDAIAELEKAIGARADDPRPVARLVECWTALGRESQAESRLRRALSDGARILDGLWIELRERQGLGLREILRDWPRGAKPPITLSTTVVEDSHRAVRVDLSEHFNVDVVAERGDLENDAFDAGSSQLLIFRRGIRLLRGLPGDRRVGVHRLGPYLEKNAVHISPDNREPFRVDVPPGRYCELRFLVTGGSCGRRVSSLSAWLEFADGRRQRVSIPCPDASWMKDSRHALPANTAVAWGGMDSRVGGLVRMDGDLALYEVTIEFEKERDLVAVEIDPLRAEYQDSTTRFHIFAITALERAPQQVLPAKS